MNHFAYRNGELYAENVSLSAVAREFGTPCYVYSRAALTESYQRFAQAFLDRSTLICYAVKANSNLAVLNLFARLGAGFDIVSGGELSRVLAAGGDPKKVVFSGVGKSDREMCQALDAGIFCFNVESESELLHLDKMAGSMGKIAPVSLRVNPDVDPKTHPYIATGLKESKFGVAFDEAPRLYRTAALLPHLNVRGIDCHIGSQITDLSSFVDALARVIDLLDRLQAEGIEISHLDLGGGLGIRYSDEEPPEAAQYAEALLARLGSRPQQLIFEPGRSLVGNAGVLLTQVEFLKHGETRNFAVVDAAMNDLMRPSLYDAYHEILPLAVRDGSPVRYEVVGPVCESGDFLGRDRAFCIEEYDLLAVMSAGAYGMSMSSNYNTRPRAAEVMVDCDQAHLIRERENAAQLFAGEHLLP